jgi:thiol:disulfide interchange protein DsbD
MTWFTFAPRRTAPPPSAAPQRGLQRPIAFVLLTLSALATGSLRAAVPESGDGFLPVERVFRYSASSDGQSVTVRWDVARGYYLYKSRMAFAADTPGFTLGAPTWPTADVHEDEYFGKQDIFRNQFAVTLPITAAAPGARTLALKLKLQGCADAGLCYPPQTWTTSVALPVGDAARGGLGALLGPQRGGHDDDFLPVDQAFRVNAVADGPDLLRLYVEIAPGYYLYRERFKVGSPAADVALGALQLPEGEIHEDEYFGKQQIYRGELIADLPVARAPGSALELPLSVGYQGCADAGLCYPPQQRTLNVTLPATGATTAGGPLGTAASSTGAAPDAFVSEQDRLARLIRSGNLLLVLGSFFAIGLGLAFTPCVLPMVPILSSLIAGQGGAASTGRSFGLSVAYVLGMACTYTLAGVLAALAGAHLQAMFQQTWIILLFGGLFVLLALSMFGLITLQMPAAIQSRLSDTSNRQRAGTLGGVAVMGALSALIVTACVAPALVATLAVIGESGNVLRGGLALFTMSLGMGAPLLAVGASAGKLLPRAGAWMDTVKHGFGVMMLGVAAWMFARLVPDRVALLLWAVPAGIAAWLLFNAVRRVSGAFWVLRLAGAAAGLYAVALVAGSVLGGSDPLAPLAGLGRHGLKQSEELEFRRIKSLHDLDAAVAAASTTGRPLLLDFYADWCVSCKEMEKYTFTDPLVKQALAPFVLLRADVTANDADDQALLRAFGILGPPTIAFYGRDGVERRAYRVVGFMKAPEFAAVAGQSSRAEPTRAAR